MITSQPPRNRFVAWLKSLRWTEIFRILLAVVLIGVVVSKTDPAEVRSLVSELSWPWLWTSLVLYLLLTFIKSFQYWMLLGRRVSYQDVTRIVVVQNAFSNLVATSAGIASYLTLFRMEQNVRVSRSGIVFIISKACDLLAMGLVLLVSALLVWGRVGPLYQVVALLLAIIFVGLCVFWAAVLFRQKFVEQLQRIVDLLHLGHVKMIQAGLDVLQSLADQEHDVIMRRLLSGLVISMAYMVVTMAYSYCRVQAFRVPLDFWAVIFIACMIQLVSLIPIQAFGGLGVVEITSVYLYEIFGIGQATMAAILIGMRVVFYLFNFVILLYLPLEALFRRVTRQSPDG